MIHPTVQDYQRVPKNINTILSRFAPFKDIPCWVVCNPDKQPCTLHAGRYETEPVRDYGVGDILRWKEEPQDHITTLYRVIAVAQMLPGYSFGPILGMGNNLACYDFDHCLDEDGTVVNEHLQEFLSLTLSFTEVSASGRGLHVFVECLQQEPEYGFSQEFMGDGKFYSGRFIKLTGNIYKDFDYSIKAISHRDHEIFRRQLEQTATARNTIKRNPCTTYHDGQTWGEILESAGIIHQPAAEYVNKTRTYPDGSQRTVIEAFRVLCPNYLAHTDHQRRSKEVRSGGGDVAILSTFSDGMTSVKCCHNSCANANLLQMLWNEIKHSRADKARSFLKRYARVV